MDASSVALKQTRTIGRRSFLHGALNAAASFFAPTTTAYPARGSDALLTIAYKDSGIPIAFDFVGLSYESAALAGGDYFTPENASVLALIRLLGDEGIVRIGGNTSERTIWNADPATTDGFAITPASIDRLSAFMRAVGWKLIYGLNLARGTPEQAPIRTQHRRWLSGRAFVLRDADVLSAPSRRACACVSRAGG